MEYERAEMTSGSEQVEIAERIDCFVSFRGHSDIIGIIRLELGACAVQNEFVVFSLEYWLQMKAFDQNDFSTLQFKKNV